MSPNFILKQLIWKILWKIHNVKWHPFLFKDPFMAGTVHAEDASTATLLGMRTRAYKFQPVADIKNITNFELRFQYSWM